MGVVDDVRKVIQDVVTPDFRALEAQVGALDKKVDLTAKTLNDKIDFTSTALNEKIDSTSKTLNDKIDATTKTLNDKIDSTSKALNEKLDSTTKALDARFEQLATKSELALTRELVVAQIHSLEMTVAKLALSIDLEKRVTKIESDRALEQVRQLEKTA